MKNILSLIFVFALGTVSCDSVFAGPAVIYNGDYVKALKDQFKLNNTASILTGTDDPTSVAKDAPEGSLYLRQGGTGAVYSKDDNGSTTNWTAIGGGGGGGSSTFLGLSDVPGSYSGEARKVPQVNAGETAVTFEDLLSSDITVPIITGAANDNLYKYLSRTNSAGILSPEFPGHTTDNGDGTVAIAAGTAVLKTTNAHDGLLVNLDFSAVASLALTDNDMNYIVLDYNSGTPQITASTSDTANRHSIINIGQVYRSGTDLSINQASRVYVAGWQDHSWEFHSEALGTVNQYGGIVSETGTRNFAATAGQFWYGMDHYNTAAFDSSAADTFTYQYRDGASGWTKVATQTTISNSQYDDGTGSLASLTGTKRGVNWIYMETDGSIHVIYGRGNYTSTEAEDAQPPGDLPPEFGSHNAFVIGKVIIQNGATAFSSIQSAFAVSFTGATATDHNDTTNIQGGTSGEYYHINANQHTLTPATATVSAYDGSNLANTVMTYSGSGARYPMQEASSSIHDVGHDQIPGGSLTIGSAYSSDHSDVIWVDAQDVYVAIWEESSDIESYILRRNVNHLYLAGSKTQVSSSASLFPKVIVSGSTIVVGYIDGSTLKLRAATVSGSANTITYGTEVSTAINVVSQEDFDLCLDSSTGAFVAIMSDSGVNALSAIVGTLSGTTITLGTKAAMAASVDAANIACVDEENQNSVVFAYNDLSDGFLKTNALTTDAGARTFTDGTVNPVGTSLAGFPMGLGFEDAGNSVMLMYDETAGDDVVVKTITVSGTTTSDTGSAVTISLGDNINRVGADVMENSDEDNFIVCYSRDEDNTNTYYAVIDNGATPIIRMAETMLSLDSNRCSVSDTDGDEALVILNNDLGDTKQVATFFSTFIFKDHLIDGMFKSVLGKFGTSTFYPMGSYIDGIISYLAGVNLFVTKDYTINYDPTSDDRMSIGKTITSTDGYLSRPEWVSLSYSDTLQSFDVNVETKPASGTWTMGASDLDRLRFRTSGTKVTLDFNMITTTISGSPTELIVLVNHSEGYPKPDPLQKFEGTVKIWDNTATAWEIGHYVVEYLGGKVVMRFSLQGDAAFAASTDLTSISGFIEYESNQLHQN